MTPQDAPMIASTAKHTPAQLAEGDMTDKVRVLAAEGKLSAWILVALPFCVAGVVQILNPKYISVLFTDAMGIKLVIGAMVLMLIGIFAMWRIIDIRV